ncbi:hypothetical protein MKY66_24275 [Paenibacillus sp. FSL R5-0766]
MEFRLQLGQRGAWGWTAGGCPIAQVEDTFTENWGVQSGFA